MAFIDELTAEDRARTYELLAAVFGAAPTDENVGALCSLAQALGIALPSRLSPAEVRREFMDLFAVPNPRYVAPYESVYRDDRQIPSANGNAPRSAGLLMGNTTLAVRQAFMDAGVLPLHDLPDHIANELRLVGHLWHVEARADAEDAAEAARQRERFVAEHLLQWIMAVGGKIAQSSATGFYRAAIEAAHALLNVESAPGHLERVLAL